MENLVSSWAKNVDTLTENYVMPPSKRPSEHVSIASSIPVIDLAKASSSTINHAGLVQELLNASQEFGIFQVRKVSIKSLFFHFILMNGG